MPAKKNLTLQDAINALEKGKNEEARQILTRLLKSEPENTEYWLWMSAAVEGHKERRYCLQKVLAIDPDYAPARRGLILMGELPAEDVAPSTVAEPFAWQKRLKPPPKAPTQKRTSPPKQALVAVGAVALLMLLVWAAWGTWQKIRPVHLATPQLLINTTFTPTPPPTKTPTPVNPLTLGKPTPLEKLLAATYTPTPLAAKTPHLIEAFRLGLRAMENKQWDEAVRYFKETLESENKPAADVHFYLGEVYRQTGKWDKAEQEYNAALKTEPDMAAALVGLGQVLEQKGKDQQALEMLNQAAEAQPNYGLTYLVRAKWFLNHKEPQKALQDLSKAEKYLPGSPLVALYRAEAYLAMQDYRHALEQAKLANSRDITLLEAYKIIGQCELETGNAGEAVKYLRTYLTYAPDDAEGYLLWARAYHNLGEEKNALLAAQKAAKEARSVETYRKIARLYLKAGKPADAVDLLRSAVRLAPKDFQTKILLVEALLANDEAGKAFKVLHEMEGSLKTQEQTYTFYYWRAKVLTALSRQGPKVKEAAVRDWQRVLNAPQDIIPDEWRKEAQRQLNLLLTPQPSPTP